MTGHRTVTIAEHWPVRGDTRRDCAMDRAPTAHGARHGDRAQ